MTLRVVLVGLPGVGKTTVGAALAVELDVPFVDLDALVEHSTGSSPAAILREGGEPPLREAELEALRAALRGSGVVATGGGTVESEAARALLGRERLVVLLEADPATLLERVSRGGDRPLVEGSVAERLALLRARRAPFYDEVADATVDASGPLADVVAAVARLAVRA